MKMSSVFSMFCYLNSFGYLIVLSFGKCIVDLLLGERQERRRGVCMCGGYVNWYSNTLMQNICNFKNEVKSKEICNNQRGSNLISETNCTAVKDLFVINCNHPRMTNYTFITHTSSPFFFPPIHSQYIYEKSTNITRIFPTSTMRWKAKKSAIINEEVKISFQSHQSFLVNIYNHPRITNYTFTTLTHTSTTFTKIQMTEMSIMWYLLPRLSVLSIHTSKTVWRGEVRWG